MAIVVGNVAYDTIFAPDPTFEARYPGIIQDEFIFWERRVEKTIAISAIDISWLDPGDLPVADVDVILTVNGTEKLVSPNTTSQWLVATVTRFQQTVFTDKLIVTKDQLIGIKTKEIGSPAPGDMACYIHYTWENT